MVDHAEQQLLALRELGVDAWLVMGNDPPGSFTHLLHPGLGRHTDPPDFVLPVGRSVIVPANGSLPNIVLTPSTPGRIKRIFERERFDVIHVHEPMTPAIGVAAVALWGGPTVATFHASGELRWMKYGGRQVWGNLLAARIDRRIAVSEQARATAERWLPGEYTIVPNGVLVPPHADPAGREHRIVFIGRHELAISRDGQRGRGDRLDCRGRKKLGLAGGRGAARECEDRSGEDGERDAHQAIHGGSFGEGTRSTHYQISAITADSSSAL